MANPNLLRFYYFFVIVLCITFFVNKFGIPEDTIPTLYRLHDALLQKTQYAYILFIKPRIFGQ